MTPFEFSAIFGLGLVSSIHCVQMCGPIVLSYSLPLARNIQWRRLAAAHAAYNLGRITTYSALGALAGLAGGGLGLVTRFAGLANGTRVLAGLAMLVAAAAISGLLPHTSLVRIDRGGIGSRLSRAAGRLLQSHSQFRLGLVLGFLPCGLVYAALLKAVETGTALAGALTMLAFGLGTAGALLTMGLASSMVGLRLGRWSSILSAASIALMGAILLWRGLSGAPAPMGHVHHG